MSIQILNSGIIKSSGSAVGENILLNSASIPGKSGSIISEGITTGIHTGNGSWNEAYWPCSISASGNPLNGKVITISLDFMTENTANIPNMYFGFGTWSSSGSRVGDLNISVGAYLPVNSLLANSKWTRIYNTFTCPTTWTTEASTYRLQIKTHGLSGVTMYFKRIKIELNDHPTEYIISPDDIGFGTVNGFLESYGTNTNSFKLGSDWVEGKEFIEI